MRLTEHDIPEIDRILSHPSVFYWAKDDWVEAPPLGIGKAALSAGIVLKPHADTLFMFCQKNCITWEVHAAILAGARDHGFSSAVQAVLWMFENTGMQKVVTWIPSFHERAIAFTVMCGLTREGVSPKSYLHNGEVFDIFYFGATKDELLGR